SSRNTRRWYFTYCFRDIFFEFGPMTLLSFLPYFLHAMHDQKYLQKRSDILGVIRLRTSTRLISQLLQMLRHLTVSLFLLLTSSISGHVALMGIIDFFLITSIRNVAAGHMLLRSPILRNSIVFILFRIRSSLSLRHPC